MSTQQPSAGNQHPAGHHWHPVVSRSERVAQRSEARSVFSDIAVFLKKKHRAKFLLLMLLTSIALSSIVGAWNVPFRFRLNGVTNRAIVCNTAFSLFSLEQTRKERDRARANTPHVFVNDPQPLIQLRESLWNVLTVLTRANSYSELGEEDKQRWLKFLSPLGHEEVPQASNVDGIFADFVVHFKNEFRTESLEDKLSRIFQPFEVRGILKQLPFELGSGSQDRIFVYPKDAPDIYTEHRVSEVLFRDGTRWKQALHDNIESPLLCELFFHWIKPQIPETLREDKNATAKVTAEAVAEVEDVMVEYAQGQFLISAGTILQPSDISLLFAEYEQSRHNRTMLERFVRFISVCSVFFFILVIMVALAFRTERRRPHTPSAFFFLMLGIIVTIAISKCVHFSVFTSADWELLPLMLFTMLISILYSWELATILSIFLTVVIVIGNGAGIDLFILLLSTSVATAVQLGRLRSRQKLVIVSVISGFIAFFLTIVLGCQMERVLNAALYADAAINFAWAVLAGLLMSGILPFIEKRFEILTDMRLLELGDISHPLIQALIKAAPATYGHSSQVGAIAETAADAVHARGLLTRVGASFHDIGKIMKPEFFSENQGGINNVHDTLEPQLSTIVLIAHVKDGVDMAKQYQLPKPLIDLIEQHHGTSLVSFFYGRATKGGKEEIEESTFRYPGPKPQTKEAAILMIADTSESACRSMGMGVPPNKVEAKIRALIKQKLDDGQFDDSGLTLNELKIIEKSVVNSIVAAMHGRIQYPESVEKHEPPHDIDQAQLAMFMTGVY